MSEIRQDPDYAQYMSLIGWHVDKVDSVFIYSKKILWFSITKIQRPNTYISFNKLIPILKKRKTLLCYIESLNDSQSQLYKTDNFKEDPSPSLPSKTIHINLSKTQNELLKSFHSKTRYNILLSQRKGTFVQKSSDIYEFCKMWSIEARKRGLFLSQEREIKNIYAAFRNNAIILNAYENKKLLGGLLLIVSGDSLYYMYAYSTDAGKSKFAPSLLVWEALLIGKKKKLKIFDFEGIYDDRAPLKHWKGFTKFKLSFNGNIKEYPLPLKKYLLPY